MRRSGARIRVEYLDVRALARATACPRVGFVVPKYKHTAVERNQLKRRLRELVRTRLLPALRGTGDPANCVGVDIVVRALPTAYGARFAGLASQVDRVSAAVQERSGAGERGSARD